MNNCLLVFGGYGIYAYICNVFFMVLDLRLTKVGCREAINFFVYPSQM